MTELKPTAGARKFLETAITRSYSGFNFLFVRLGVMIAIGRRPRCRAGRRAKKLDFFLFQKFKVKITVIIGVKLAPSPSTRHNLATATPGGLPPASEASRPHAHARPGSGTPIKPPLPL